MIVQFKNALVLDCHSGTSKKGNAYGVLKFLSEDAEVFEVFVSSDGLAILDSIQPKNKYTLTFDLVPGWRNGVTLNLCQG